MVTQPWPLTMKAVLSYLQRDKTKCFETCCMISIQLFASQQLIPLLDGPRKPIVFMASLGIHQGMWRHKDGMPLLQWPLVIPGGPYKVFWAIKDALSPQLPPQQANIAGFSYRDLTKMASPNKLYQAWQRSHGH